MICIFLCLFVSPLVAGSIPIVFHQFARDTRTHQSKYDEEKWKRETKTMQNHKSLFIRYIQTIIWMRNFFRLL